MAFTNTYDLTAKHKALSDFVSLISPEKTPFQEMVGKESVTNTLFNWAEIELAAAADNAWADGAAIDTGTATLGVEKQNYTQIFRKVVSLSRTAQAVATAGAKQKMKEQTKLKAAELKRDIERAYVGTAQVAAAGSASTPRKTAGYQAQIDSSVTKDMAGAALTEADLNALLVALNTNGASPSVIMTTPAGVMAIAKALEGSSNGRVREMGSKHVTGYGVSVYSSFWGDLEIVSNPFVKQGDILVFEPEMWSECVLTPYELVDAGKNFDGDTRLLVVEKGLKNKNSKGSGLITNVKVS